MSSTGTKKNGYSLVEIMVSISILGLLALAGVPAFANMQRRAALRAASQELRTIFYLARSRAIARNVNTGLRFFKVGNQWLFGVYEDGDYDGLRTNDIASGTDRLIGTPRVVLPESRAISIGLPAYTIVDPAGTKLTAGSSPVKFNTSSICSFSPLGESTPGTIYLTDRAGDVFAVRVFGGSARIRVLRYLPNSKKWVP